MANPRLRFRRTDGSEYPDWETRQLDEFVTASGRKNTSNKDLEIYSVNNREGFVPQDDQFDKAGYLKGISKNKYQIVEPGEFAYNPARINVSSIGLLRENTPVLISPMYAVFKVSGNISAEYLLRWLKSANFQKIVRKYSAGSVRQTLMLPTLREVTTPVPSLEEQSKIAKFLSALDDVIAYTSKELEDLELLKRGAMQRIFSRKVRFLRDDGSAYPEWETMPFGSLYEKNLERNSNREFPYSRTISIASMSFNEQGNGASTASLTSYKVLRMGDIAFEGHTNKRFAFGRFVLNDIGDGIISPRFTCLRPKRNLLPGFWKYYIHHEPIMRPILIRATKKGAMMNELVCEELAKQTIAVPCLEEQAKIAAFLTAFDDAINRTKAELDLWRLLKRGLTQQMFA